MKNNTVKSVPIFLAFLCMGFGDVVGPLTSQLQHTYHLSNFLAGLVTFMGFIMFGLLSVPMSLYQDRKGKKFVLQAGLILALAGLLLPIIGNYSSFGLLLGSLLLLGTGATTLQVAGNPIMRDVSPKGKYSRNLSFGQFIKAIGSLSGALIPLAAVNYFGKDWRILFPIYAVAVLITVVYLMSVKIEEKKDERVGPPASFASVLKLLGNPYILMMVLGIFLYVGAEVSMSAKLPNYLEHKFGFNIETLGLLGTLFFFLALMTGRFLGGVILNWMSPKKFLILTAILSLVGIAGLYLAPTQVLGITAIAVIGLGFANVFPLIFSITIDHMPERSNEISGLMVTAIIGGALVPLVTGLVADMFTLMAGFIVPALCLFYILIISLNKANR
ncbi:MAG TPA: MFS transporter [Bacteroidales bacterium]|nr:MFS transporter [Bacteroidales bacterium]